MIIIQSDHSDMVLSSDHFDRSIEKRSTKLYNLSAIYLPNGRQHEILSDTSNVNTFRYVFNLVFNARLPILPNKHYSSGRNGRHETMELMPDFSNDYIK